MAIDREEYERRMEAREARKAAAEAAREERRMKDDLLFDDLEQEHGDGRVARVSTQKGMVVVRVPEDAEYQRWRATSKKAKKAQADLEAGWALGRRCVIHPDRATFESWVEEFPGLADKVQLAALRLADAVQEDEAGK